MEYDLDELAAKIEEMPYAPWVIERPKPALSGMDFSAGAGRGLGDKVAAALTNPIHEGGAGDHNRWSEFSKVAGHHIHCARAGHYDVSEAARLTYGWMLAEMRPPWADARFEQEFRGVLEHDVKEKGAIKPPQMPVTDLPPDRRGFRQWDVGNTLFPPEPRRFLVPGLVQAEVPHTVVADSGVGKTFMLLDLGLKLAATAGGMRGLEWFGKQIDENVARGVVVMLTAEDDQREIHIRLDSIDPDYALRRAATGLYRVVPLQNEGGAFPLVAHAPGGEPAASRAWLNVQTQFQQIVEDGDRIMLVMIDTVAATLHGEENRSNVITEYYTELAKLGDRFGCASMVSHHIRKTNKAQPIRDKEDMKAAVRGSSAILGSSRVVLGLWHAYEHGSILKTLGEDPKTGACFKFAVIKANNPEMDEQTRTLLREKTGLLIDVTDKVMRMEESVWLMQLAWLQHVIGEAAKARRPYTATNSNGVFARRGEMPEELKHVTVRRFADLVDTLISKKRIFKGALKTKAEGYLDIEDGPLHRGAYKDGGILNIDWNQWYYRGATGEIIKR